MTTRPDFSANTIDNSAAMHKTRFSLAGIVFPHFLYVCSGSLRRRRYDTKRRSRSHNRPSDNNSYPLGDTYGNLHGRAGSIGAGGCWPICMDANGIWRNVGLLYELVVNAGDISGASRLCSHRRRIYRTDHIADTAGRYYNKNRYCSDSDHCQSHRPQRSKHPQHYLLHNNYRNVRSGDYRRLCQLEL